MGGLFGGKSTISNTETRIGALQLQQSTYGAVNSVVFGTNRVYGNLLDYIDFTAIAHTTTQTSGGKGGGGVTQKNTSYTYTVAAIIGLGEGAIAGIGRIWKDKEVYLETEKTESFPWQNNGTICVSNSSYWTSTVSVKATAVDPEYGYSVQATAKPGVDYTDLENGQYTMLNGDFTSIQITYKYIDPVLGGTIPLGLSLFAGADNQQPWSYMQSVHPERALTYPKTAYVCSPTLDLGSSASLPNYNFELKGRDIATGFLDANPKDIITAILSDSQIGVGFSSQYISDLTMYSNYCIVNGVRFSPAYTAQDETHSTITTLCQASNSEPVWTQGKLKIVPYGLEEITANGVTYTPPPAPVYPELTLDDFVYEEGEPPVIVRPKLAADRYNIQPVEIMNRDNDYNVEPIKATDDANINDVGPRPADSIEMHFITTPEVGLFAAQSILQRQLYVPNEYEFTLTWRHCLFDPMDIALLTETEFLDLIKVPVRIVTITEDDSYNLKVIAEDCPEGITNPAVYDTQSVSRTAVNYNAAPGNVNQPVIFCPPSPLSDGLTVWIGASGGPSWGGCTIWVSEDRNTYKRNGQITNPSRQGVLSAALPLGTDPDTTDTLAVDMTMSRGQLLSGTQADADNYNTLCYVGGELISYQTATLTAANKYNLSYLRRGAYGTTIAQHNAGSQFIRIDKDALFAYPINESMNGKTIYLKLTSFNIFGQAEQALEDVAAITYTIQTNITPGVKTVQKTKSIDTIAGWTTFTIDDGGFADTPQVFYVVPQTYGTQAYYRNVTAMNFEAIVVNTTTGAATTGSFLYVAQGKGI